MKKMRTTKIFPSDKVRGLYIHIPFCRRKCRYCDFVSFAGKEEYTQRYIAELIKELHLYEGNKIDTVFIGGGTPTILNNDALEYLCKNIFKLFDIQPGYEFTIEANPGTIDYDKAALLAENGVNRISMGVQSFNDEELKSIGRIHNAKTAFDTVTEVNRAGIRNISIDLMSALPGQSISSLKNSLQTAMQLPINHISVYSLIIEDETPMAHDYANGAVTLPDEDTEREMYAFTKQFLARHGLYQYEISNFSKPGYESRHNIKYWECNEYIGAGIAAHSYVDGVRCSNTVSFNEYLNGNYSDCERDVLSNESMIFEYIIMGMRMNRGISEADYQNRFNENIYDRYGALLKKFEKGGFIELTDGYIRFTDRGRDVSNAVLCEFSDV